MAEWICGRRFPLKAGLRTALSHCFSASPRDVKAPAENVGQPGGLPYPLAALFILSARRNASWRLLKWFWSGDLIL